MKKYCSRKKLKNTMSFECLLALHLNKKKEKQMLIIIQIIFSSLSFSLLWHRNYLFFKNKNDLKVNLENNIF